MAIASTSRQWQVPHNGQTHWVGAAREIGKCVELLLDLNEGSMQILKKSPQTAAVMTHQPSKGWR